MRLHVGGLGSALLAAVALPALVLSCAGDVTGPSDRSSASAGSGTGRRGPLSVLSDTIPAEVEVPPPVLGDTLPTGSEAGGDSLVVPPSDSTGSTPGGDPPPVPGDSTGTPPVVPDTSAFIPLEPREPLEFWLFEEGETATLAEADYRVVTVTLDAHGEALAVLEGYVWISAEQLELLQVVGPDGALALGHQETQNGYGIVRFAFASPAGVTGPFDVRLVFRKLVRDAEPVPAVVLTEFAGTGFQRVEGVRVTRRDADTSSPPPPGQPPLEPASPPAEPPLEPGPPPESSPDPEAPPAPEVPPATEAPPAPEQPPSTEAPPVPEAPPAPEPPAPEAPPSTEAPPAPEQPPSTEAPPAPEQPPSTEAPSAP